MQLGDYDYALPDRLIARAPLPARRGSRLLEVSAALRDRGFAELPSLLRAGDLLVFNDTRVIPARLHGHKATGGKVEVLVERVLAPQTVLAHVRASKPPRTGGLFEFPGGVGARVGERRDDLWELTFDRDVDEVLAAHGEVPLPPYLERAPVDEDRERYQTVYAREPGAVAAPTAGLHFDQRMLDETLAMGVRHAYVTLHVGAGTFQNLRHEQIESNRLHSERVHVDAACCERVAETRRNGGRVICVGTTAVRSLEAASAGGTLAPFTGETDLFILPGYRFRSVDAMITNFHLPRSSLLLLVAAFAGGDRVLEAYRHAVDAEYRFFSYGDSMFVEPAP